MDEGLEVILDSEEIPIEVLLENDELSTDVENDILYLKGEKGDKGDKGDIGEKGDAFTYEDFTTEQLEALRGPQGISDVIVSSTEPTTSEKVWIQKGKNWYDIGKYPFTLKIAYNGSGELVSWGGYSGIQGYVKVEPNKQYAFSSDIYTEGKMLRVVYYDKSQSVLSTEDTNSGIFTTPANCEYIRFTVSNEVLPSWAQLEQGTAATSYEPYVEPKIYVKNDNGVYEEFYKENETLLYSSSGSNGTITLNDAPTKYKEIEIYYKNSGGTLSSSVKVCPSEVAGIDCTLLVYDTNGTIYFVLAKLTISNSQLVPSQYGQTSFTTANVNKTDVTTNPIYVYKVVGRN